MKLSDNIILSADEFRMLMATQVTDQIYEKISSGKVSISKVRCVFPKSRYCPRWDSDQIIIGKTHPNLLNTIEPFKALASLEWDAGVVFMDIPDPADIVEQDRTLFI